MNLIEIHIDFSCPFSYLGGERMIQYLEDNNELLTNIRFRSFQLAPDDDNTHKSYIQNRFQKSNFSTIDEYRKFFNEGIGRAALELGLHYDVDNIISVNSLHAHMGLQYATLYAKQVEYFREVMRGHFETGKDFYDFDFIDDVLHKLNLDTNDFHQRENKMKELVKKDIMLAYERSISSVPTFYQNGIVLQGTGSYKEFDQFMK